VVFDAEPDQALRRDMMQDDPEKVLEASTDVLLPSVVKQVQRMDLQSPNVEPPSSTLPKSTQLRKRTTAKAFFGNSSTSKPSVTKQTGSKIVKSAGPSNPKGAAKNSLEKKNEPSKPAFPKRTKKPEPKTQLPSSKRTKSTLGKAVSNAQTPRPSSRKLSKKREPARENDRVVGTADDFVGDVDEDEEFLEQDAARRRRNRLREEREQKQRERVEAQAQRLREITAAPVTPVQMPGRKRRKRLVEKTSMDSNGYLHTETKAVWEEVVVEETVKPKVPKTKKPANKQRKQGDLRSFFGKR